MVDCNNVFGFVIDAVVVVAVVFFIVKVVVVFVDNVCVVKATFVSVSSFVVVDFVDEDHDVAIVEESNISKEDTVEPVKAKNNMYDKFTAFKLIFTCKHILGFTYFFINTLNHYQMLGL